MSCASLDQVAAAAAGEADAGALAHAAVCTTCRAALADQRAMRVRLAALPPVPPLAPARRSALAAELLARSDIAPRPRALAPAIAVGVLAIAAAITLVVVTRQRANAPGERAPLARTITAAPARPLVATGDRDAGADPSPEGGAEPAPAVVPAPEPAERPARIAGRADFTRRAAHGRDVVDLRDGELTVDTRRARAVDVTRGPTELRIRGAKASIVARAGVIEQVRVFAGSVELVDADTRTVITAGVIWQRPAPPPPAEARPAPDPEAFREGWQALRQDRHADAIAAFDRATGEAVVEDATFWAAVAAERAGDRADAARRYTEFLARFPRSPHAARARDALRRVAD